MKASNHSKREEALVGLTSPEARKMYEKSFRKWQKRLQPLIDRIHESQRITGDDLKIIVR